MTLALPVGTPRRFRTEDWISAFLNSWARAAAVAYGLRVDDAVVLNDSNRLAVHLRPCDVLARVARARQNGAKFEVEVARRLAESGVPLATLDPRVEPRVHGGAAPGRRPHQQPLRSPVPIATCSARR